MSALFCALLLAAPGATALSVRAPAGPGGDCLSCHAQYAAKKVVHPPVKNGLCSA